MSKDHLQCADGCQDLAPWLATLPDRIDGGEGRLLFNGRNRIAAFSHEGRTVVVKRFKPLGWLKGVVYTFFRKSKARRALENAMELKARGFDTPRPVACIERRRHGLMAYTYYICAYTDWPAIREPVAVEQPFDKLMTADFADFVARLHEAGILFRDLNNTNVLYHRHEGGYDFQLIDINRMTFLPEGEAVGRKKSMENISLFCSQGAAFDYFLKEYVRQRGWDASLADEARRVKRKHDRHYQRKKALKRLIKRQQ